MGKMTPSPVPKNEIILGAAHPITGTYKSLKRRSGRGESSHLPYPLLSFFSSSSGSQFPLSVQTGWARRSVGTATGGRAGADAAGLGFLQPAAPCAVAAGLECWGMALAESGGWTA